MGAETSVLNTAEDCNRQAEDNSNRDGLIFIIILDNSLFTIGLYRALSPGKTVFIIIGYRKSA